LNGIVPRDDKDRSPVLKAFRLLTHLATSPEPVALAELSRALKLPKPTTHRLAQSIERAGFLQKDALTRRYRVGAALEDLAIGALRHGTSHASRRLIMNRLAERLGARVNLVVLRAGSISSVEWVESTAPLRVDIDAGLMPVHCTASGKLLLAFGSAAFQKRILNLAPFRSHTKKTITGRRVLAHELEKIRRCGFAEDDQELFSGVNCLAVPIRNRADDVVAGLAVMAPSAMLSLAKIRDHLPEIRKCAAMISGELGWNDRAQPTTKASVERQPSGREHSVDAKRLPRTSRQINISPVKKSPAMPTSKGP
jgi:IclR family transcriptional regulator, acetate operon repressor